MISFLTAALLAVSTHAHASSPTINLASVGSESEGLTVSVGSGAALLAYGPLPSARTGLEFTQDRLHITSSSTTYFGSQNETFNLIGAGWAIKNGKGFRTGPVLNVSEHRGSSDLDHRISMRAGWSIDAEGERLGFDMTLSLAGLAWHPDGDIETPFYRLSTLDTLTVSELGVRKRWGDHRVRVGLFGILPTAGYAWDNGIWRLRGDVATMGTRTLAWLSVGRRL